MAVKDMTILQILDYLQDARNNKNCIILSSREVISLFDYIEKLGSEKKIDTREELDTRRFWR